jgi:hypothetical protein
VLTLEHCAAVGHHYYSSSSIRESIYGLVHCLVRRRTITNDTHYTTRVLLRRLFTATVNWYIGGNWNRGMLHVLYYIHCADVSHTGQARPVHVIDVESKDGLNDIMALGTVIELSRALDQQVYSQSEIDHDEQHEIDAAISRYRLFMRWFSSHFAFIIHGEWLYATYLFKKRLIDFAATILRYVTEQSGHALNVDDDHSLSPASMKKQILAHLIAHHRELQGYWRLAEKKASVFLFPDHQHIQVVQLSDEKRKELEAGGLVEKHDSMHAPIKIPVTNPSAAPQVRRARRATTPPIASTSSAPPAQPSTPPPRATQERRKRGPPSPETPKSHKAPPAKKKR